MQFRHCDEQKRTEAIQTGAACWIASSTSQCVRVLLAVMTGLVPVIPIPVATPCRVAKLPWNKSGNDCMRDRACRANPTFIAESRAYFFLAARCARAAALAATAARMSCLKATTLIFSPSRMSIARRTFPSRLELKSFFGSSMEAPRAKVSFTTCLYDSPCRRCRHGTRPESRIRGFTHFHSSSMSGSASWISLHGHARDSRPANCQAL